jgi:hypothetical protein
MNKRSTNWKDFIFENGSYKLVSLFVTLILWVTILGRRDFMLTKDMDVEFLLPPNAVMQSARGERKISVKVSGPRTALKKFAQSPGSITFDLTKSEVEQKNTKIKAVIQVKNIEVPFGVKVVSIDPDAIEVVLSPIPTVSVPEDEDVLNLKDRPEKGKQK